MTVKRIVPNIAAEHFAQADPFYGEVLDFKVAMDFGWIRTFANEGDGLAQVSILSATV